MKRHILLAFGFIFAALASKAAVGDRFQVGDIYYEVLSESPYTCQTAAANYNIELVMKTEPDYTTSWPFEQKPVLDSNGNPIYELQLTGELDRNAAQWANGNVGPNWEKNYNNQVIEIPSEVKFGDQVYTVTAVGDFSFAATTASTQTIKIPSTVTSIGKGAFWGYGNLQNLDLGNIETLGDYAFKGCGVKNIEIPGTLEKLGEGIFTDSKLQYVTIKEGVKEIDPKAFDGVVSLKSLEIPGTVSKIEAGTFQNNPDLEELILHDGITGIGESAFANCGIKNLTIPGSVEKLENNVFAFCKLEYLTIQEGVKEIDPNAFEGVVNLKSLEIPGTVSKIEAGTFQNNPDLKELKLHDGITGIGESAFANCGIENLTIPGSLNTLGDEAFKGCSNLESVTFEDGEGTLEMGKSVFEGNTALKSVRLSNKNKEISENAFKDCQSLKTVEFAEGLTKIGKSAFENCSGIGTDLILPDSLIEIDDAGFKGCTSIHYISFGKNLEKVGKEGFYRVCFNKAGMYLPASLTDIGTNAFNFQTNGSNLTDIYYPNSNPVPTEPNAFGYDDDQEYKNYNPDYWIYSTVCLHVPVGTAQTYRQLTDWKYFRCIIDDLIPEDAESTHTDPEDPLAYIIDYIYLIPGETRNLNELIGETEDSMEWDPIDSEILTLNSNGDLVANSYGNDIALGYRKGNFKDTQWNGSREIEPSLAGAVIIFVCPTITVVYDRSNNTQVDGPPIRMNKAPRRVEEISENTTEAQDLKTHNTTYSHYVVSGSFPKVQVNPAPSITISNIERAAVDDYNNYIPGEELKDVDGKLMDTGDEKGYTGSIVPQEPITENRMLVVTLDLDEGIMTGAEEIEIDDKISVAVSGRTLSIIGADEDAEVLVSDIKGHIVYSGTGKVISLEPGIYIVKVEDAAFKAIVR